MESTEEMDRAAAAARDAARARGTVATLAVTANDVRRESARDLGSIMGVVDELVGEWGRSDDRGVPAGIFVQSIGLIASEVAGKEPDRLADLENSQHPVGEMICAFAESIRAIDQFNGILHDISESEGDPNGWDKAVKAILNGWTDFEIARNELAAFCTEPADGAWDQFLGSFVQANAVLDGFVARYSSRIRGAELRDLENVGESEDAMRAIDLVLDPVSDRRPEAQTPAVRPPAGESASAPRIESSRAGWAAWLRANAERLLTLQRDLGAAVATLQGLDSEAVAVLAGGQGSKPANPVTRLRGLVGKLRHGDMRSSTYEKRGEYQKSLEALGERAKSLSGMCTMLAGTETETEPPGVVRDLIKLLATITSSFDDDALIEKIYDALMMTDSYAGHAQLDWHYREKRPVLVGAKQQLAQARSLASQLLVDLESLTGLGDCDF
jgi:hypothetical protein